MSDFSTIVRPAQPEHVDIVAKLQASDDHPIFVPTFVVERDEHVVGAVQIHLMPIVAFWFSRTLSRPHNARDTVGFVENSLREKGSVFAAVTCNEASPFRRFVERVGYTKANELFIKRL